MSEALHRRGGASPVGERGGGLSQVHPADLGAHLCCVDRSHGIDPAWVDEVVFGCLDRSGGKPGMSPARAGWRGAARLVPGTTVDRQCGSSQQAVSLPRRRFRRLRGHGGRRRGAAHVGDPDLVLDDRGRALRLPDPFSGSPGGPPGTARKRCRSSARRDDRREVGHHPRRHGGVRGRVAPSPRWARAEGRFDARSSRSRGSRTTKGPQPQPGKDPFVADAGGGRTPDRGRVVADLRRSAALLIATKPRCRRAQAARPDPPPHRRGDDPMWMLTAPIPATAYALEKTGMRLTDIDLVEINEAFASVVLAWPKDPAPTSTSQRQRRRHRPRPSARRHRRPADDDAAPRTGTHRRTYGLQTMCEGGGQANVTIIERL